MGSLNFRREMSSPCVSLRPELKIRVVERGDDFDWLRGQLSNIYEVKFRGADANETSIILFGTSCH
jgi:hypothetical protein